MPERVAIELVRAGEVHRTTYAALDARAAQYAGWLHSTGLVAGDRVSILSDNDAEWIAAYLGILRLGAVAVPLDTAYSAVQVRTVMGDAGARVLLVSARYADTARAAIAGAAGAEALAARVVLLSGRASGTAGASEIDHAPPAPPFAVARPDEAAVILYTSGTTADPKGVVLTHANLEAERAAALSIVHVTEADAVLGVLPLFHSLAQMANLLLPLAVGARVVFLDTVSATSLLAALDTRGITIFACVPQFFYLIHQRVVGEVAKSGALRRALFRALLGANAWLRDHAGWNPGRRIFARVHRVLGPNMRVLVTGGSRFDPTIGRDLYAMGFTLLNAYGLTETSGGATIVRPGDRFTTSVGQAFPGTEIRIGARESAEAGDASDHQDGEILIRGPIVMREYYKRPDATREALDDGWLHTGDLGRLDADGRLYITGRKKEIIVLASGKNLYPEEIESHYRQADIIKELCIVGLSRPDQPSAERLHAVIVPDEDAMRRRGVVNLKELVRFEIEGRSVTLPAHKRILSYDISLEPLPRTTTGKIKRHEVERRLRAQAAGAEKSAGAPREATASESAWLAEPAHRELMSVAAARLAKPALMPDANLELDLGLDSLERVELLTHVEAHAAAAVAPAARQTIFTVRQLVDAVLAAPRTEPGDAGADATSRLAWDTMLTAPPAADLVANLSRPKWITSLILFATIRVLGWLAKAVVGFRVEGREHLPAAGPFLISPNHQAYLDGFFLAAALPFRVFKQLFFVGAAEYFSPPLMSRVARAVNIVPVDPDANLVNAMRAGAAGLRLKKVLILFPEGERSIDGTLKQFRKGAAILSAHLEAPIVPVALDGLFDLWPRGRSFQWRRLLPGRSQRVTLRFGPPIRVERGQYDAGTADLKAAVARMFRP